MLRLRHLLTFALCLLAAAQAFAAGTVDFVTGTASVTSPNGSVSLLAKGQKVKEGDILVTGKDGEIHVVMDDNALIAVRPNTRLKIESYRAEGRDNDSAVFRLFRGAFRSVTGWIGKNKPEAYAVKTQTATIGIRGTDHEPLVIEEGEAAQGEPGTYDKVYSGSTAISNPFGEVIVKPDQVAFVPKAATTPPKLIPVAPPAYKPSAHEDQINTRKQELEKTLEQRLKEKRDENARQGTGSDGKPRVMDMEKGKAALDSLNEFLRAFENGNVGLIQSRLDPSMIGYQQFLDKVRSTTNVEKQIRFNLTDTLVIPGPDVALIETNWERRGLDMPSFNPRLDSGHSSILMHQDNGTWTIGAIAGDNPFSFSHTAQLALGGLTAGGTYNEDSTPFHITLTVTDPDIAGQPSVQVSAMSQHVGACGTTILDRETYTLTAVSPGVFTGSFTLGTGPRGFNNGYFTTSDRCRISSPDVRLTFTYTDNTPATGIGAVSITQTVYLY